MVLDWALIFSGASGVSAAIQAVKAVIDTRTMSRQEVIEIAKEAEVAAISDENRAVEAGKKLEAFDEDMQDVIRKKIKKAKEKWSDTIDQSDDQKDWTRATDKLKSEICGILRTIKQINGGLLPDEWYDLWVQNQCA